MYSEEVLKRFHSKVDKTKGCWVWGGWTNNEGYGYFQPTSQKKVRAHRLMYELENGPIPKGHVLDHTCENKSCVNPDHLDPVTVQVNNQRRFSR